MELVEFEKQLNTYLAVELFQDYCPNGLQVEGRKEIQKVATAVSANEQTLQAAAKRNIDALIVHHGLFWNRDPYPLVGSKMRKIKYLVDCGISLFAYHLPLDAHREVGNNWGAARQLGWSALDEFTEIGVRGEVSPIPIKAFVAELESFYDHSAAFALGGSEMIASAALISGGAYKELSRAAKAGVDCFITGNFDEPAWSVAYEEGIHFIAMGHSATERVGPLALADYIQSDLKLSCEFLDIPNPF